mmetsp:Transcript_9899/g.30544  ORF Transcript_9899/g.30544 Transcript_9899/m.30544 type:complete len:204 (+) Transcript_9899:630-1241(+)
MCSVTSAPPLLMRSMPRSIGYESYTGVTVVRPWPTSSTTPVVRPEAYSAHRPCGTVATRSTSNDSNMVCTRRSVASCGLNGGTASTTLSSLGARSSSVKHALKRCSMSSHFVTAPCATGYVTDIGVPSRSCAIAASPVVTAGASDSAAADFLSSLLLAEEVERWPTIAGIDTVGAASDTAPHLIVREPMSNAITSWADILLAA